MSTSDIQTTDQDEQLYCYGHPKEPTRLRCSRCDRPICGRCAIPASVGQHCPECVAEARKSAPKVRTAMRAVAPAVRAIIAIDILVFILQAATGANSGPITEALILNPFLVDAGEWWRLFTPMLLHGGALHLFLNMYILYIYGPNVEEAFGTARFIVLFLVTGFMGSVFSYAFPPVSFSLGASGAIFGIVGVLVVYLYKRRDRQAIRFYLKNMGFFIIANLVFGFLFPGIDNLAHIGGLFGGVLLGLGFDRGKTSEATSPVAVQIVTVAAVLLLGAALVLGS